MIDVRMFTVGPVQENCFIVRERNSKRGVIIDPGEESERLLEALRALEIEQLDAILLTHTHFDHVGAVAPVARATGAPVVCPELERHVLANIMDFVPWPGFGPFESYEADQTVKGGETLDVRRSAVRGDLHSGPQPGPRHLRARRGGSAVLRATCCLRDRSAAWTFRAGTGRRCWARSRAWSHGFLRRRPCIRATWASPPSGANAPRNPFLRELAQQ